MKLFFRTGLVIKQAILALKIKCFGKAGNKDGALKLKILH